jgi:hypothetical protein
MIPTSPSLAGSQEVPEFPDVTLTLTLDSRETWPTTGRRPGPSPSQWSPIHDLQYGPGLPFGNLLPNVGSLTLCLVYSRACGVSGFLT